MNNIVRVAPVDGLAQLKDVASGLLNWNAVRHLFEQLQHVLAIRKYRDTSIAKVKVERDEK